MDIELKQKALKKLAQTAGDVAENAIEKELAKIIDVLQNETDYKHISDQLELLDTIAYRVHEDALVAIKELLERLKSLELTNHEILGCSTEQIRLFQNNYTLILKAIEVLENIRYHQPPEILDIFFEYSDHKEERISNKAKHGIERFAEYNLDIFYGDGKDWPGLGSEPQKKVLEKITSFDEAQKKKYFSAIIIACKKILSPTISGTSSTYKTVTWRSGALPAKYGVQEVRQFALDELQKLYVLAKDVRQKKVVLDAMRTATHFPQMGNYGDDVQAMIIENSIVVAEFMKSIVVSDNMQIMQKIEHDAYWLLYHKGSLDEAISKVLLEIRDLLYADEEYNKFRILIGFESIFHDWEKGRKDSDDIERENKYREAEALKLAESINEDSYTDWREHILGYASIKSDDLATFPYFGKFLENFGKHAPRLALDLIENDSDRLGHFIIAIMCGISGTEHKADVFSLIEQWCDNDTYLYNLARFFEYSPELNEELIKKIFDNAVTNNDLNTLNQIVSSISAQYDKENKHLIQDFFIPALRELTAHKNSDWLFGFWFRKQRDDILNAMDASEHKVILDNLLWLHEIDYHAEDTLSVIAKKSPDIVVQFFCNRLTAKKDEEDLERYNAIPFSFHKLSEPLSKHPEQVVDAVYNTYDGNYGIFIYRGARLLQNIFPNFPQEFQEKLLGVA